MSSANSSQIRFFESSANIVEIIKRNSGRKPPSRVAREISVCIQQGRLFFEAAENSPLEIRPLQIYYGLLGYARAVILAKRLEPLNSLVAAHGLADSSDHDGKIEDLKLKFQRKGTFQEFNDVVSKLGRFWYHEKAMPKWNTIPFGESANLYGDNINIREIFSRVPYLDITFERTFGEPSYAVPLDIQYRDDGSGHIELQIDDSELFSTRDGLIKIVAKWRRKIPFLSEWTLCEANLAWGSSVLVFGNIVRNAEREFSDGVTFEKNGKFSMSNYTAFDHNIPRIDIFKSLPPLSGGISHDTPCYVEPYNGVYLSEYSLHFLGCFMLSSLVRYRPQIWQNAISRSISERGVTDDRCLALVEHFLKIVLDSFPTFVANAIDYSRTPR